MDLLDGLPHYPFISRLLQAVTVIAGKSGHDPGLWKALLINAYF